MDPNSRQFQAIFDQSPAGMVMLSPVAEVLYANNVVATMLGVNPDRLDGARFDEMLFPDDQESFRQELAAMRSGARTQFQDTLRYTNRDGEIAWARLHFTYVTDHGQEPSVFGVIEDITVEKSGQEQLRREKESAERATRTKSAFLANMSHEIRTPLHTITGVTELLQETQLDEEQIEYANQIKFSAEVLLGLINDVLDFSKIEAGKLSLEVIEFDLFDMVQEAVDMLSLEAHKKDLEVVVFLDPTLPRHVHGDPVRLRQILVNLFNNAVKFTSSGEIVIRAQRVQQTDTKVTVSVEVADSGIGIPEQKLTKLFKAFSQVDSSTTRKFGGTGLGLSISRSLVKLMKGNIGVKSTEGRGSTFWFAVPLGVESSGQVFDGEAGAGARVLIVDDHGLARSVLRHYLEAAGATVEESPNGPEGLRELKRAADAGEAYDIAFIDLLMPGMDGWQMASEINADKRINSTRLILLSPTGRSAGEAKMKLLKWFDAYLSKPLKVDDISNALQAVLGSDMDLPTLEEAPVEELEEVEDESEAEPGATILVAEDHFVNQQLFKTILEKRGYETILAGNGREAVELSADHDVDLVFMDVHMPEMNGYEATRTLRERGFEVPIVAVTANVTKGEKDRCIEAGMNDYLAKPFKSHDLTPLLHRWLTARETPRAKTSAAAPPPEGADAPAPEPAAAPAAAAGDGDSGNGDSGNGDAAGRPVFEYQAALEAFMNQPEVVSRVVGKFVERTDQQLEELKGQIESGAFEDARIVAHTIKGGSWNLEALRLGDAAALLEETTRNADTEGSWREYAKVAEEFEQLRTRLSEIEELKV
ncbi:MAG: response regulator [Spirochaetes bacterium]|jgi:PAS domain S-box-containing protein|nr:response regulator [Spirochaetota bacterium]